MSTISDLENKYEELIKRVEKIERRIELATQYKNIDCINMTDYELNQFSENKKISHMRYDGINFFDRLNIIENYNWHSWKSFSSENFTLISRVKVARYWEGNSIEYVFKSNKDNTRFIYEYHHEFNGRSSFCSYTFLNDNYMSRNDLIKLLCELEEHCQNKNEEERLKRRMKLEKYGKYIPKSLHKYFF